MADDKNGPKQGPVLKPIEKNIQELRIRIDSKPLNQISTVPKPELFRSAKPLPEPKPNPKLEIKFTDEQKRRFEETLAELKKQRDLIDYGLKQKFGQYGSPEPAGYSENWQYRNPGSLDYGQSKFLSPYPVPKPKPNPYEKKITIFLYMGLDGKDYDSPEALQAANRDYKERLFTIKPREKNEPRLKPDKTYSYKGFDGREYDSLAALQAANRDYNKRFFEGSPEPVGYSENWQYRGHSPLDYKPGIGDRIPEPKLTSELRIDFTDEQKKRFDELLAELKAETPEAFNISKSQFPGWTDIIIDLIHKGKK